ncbi:MAG: TIGR04283 family arsenosugar biosynthesis glycosyltransferase [Acidobacteriota bacterium]|nr:MAG: TIGR04283 family arsenosugar biosynthesis glycosyltransferase [Acidobacteriota bacterium]
MIRPEISVIIPTLNEEDNLGATLQSCLTDNPHEVIVVDGGSQDRTRDIARGFPISLYESSPGRARQMNAGAAAARGTHLLFLHADTLLPAAWENEIRRVLEIPGTVAGAFRLQINGDRRALRLVESIANLRSSLLGLPYGDQGLFLTQDLFMDLGGFPDLPIMEDLELVRQLSKRGSIRLSSSSIVTSGRRWQRLGVFKTTLINQLLIWAYLVGISPTRLAAIYRKNRAA